MTMQIEITTALAMGSGALGLGAWVVAWVVAQLRKDLGRMTDEMRGIKEAENSTATQLTEHIRLTEKRLTMLEVEFGYLRRFIKSTHPEGMHESKKDTE